MISNCNLTKHVNIAWEFLRRNPSYKNDKNKHKQEKGKPPATGQYSCTNQTLPDLEAHKWSLLAFQHEKNNQDPFWHPDFSQMTIEAETLIKCAYTDIPPFVPTLHKSGAVVKGLRLLDDRLCLNVSSMGSVVQLMFSPGTLLDENSVVGFTLPFDINLPIQAVKIQFLWDLANGKAKKMLVPQPKEL